MRVLIAPDKFAGTLSAVEVATAIADGWRRAAPGDEVITMPLSDGGPGFVDVLYAARGGRLQSVTVSGPQGHRTPAIFLLAGDTAYVESAQACGLALIEPDRRDPERQTTYGVGELIAAAVDAGARRIVIGLGGSGTNDGGAGMLAALGASPADGLNAGGAGLPELTELDLGPARSRVAGVELLAASDVDNPLLGLRGATNIFGPQKGVHPDRLVALDAALEHFAGLVGHPADVKGAGAAGGLGYGLAAIGARRVPGFDTISEAVGLSTWATDVDLLISGEGSFDIQSAAGKVISGVAAAAELAVKPCVVLAGQVHLSTREMRVMGVQSAYSMLEVAGREAAFGRPAQALADLAERVARTWSR